MIRKAVITILKKAGLYHGLQSSYRSSITAFKKHYYRLAYSKYQGSGYTCNFCRESYKQFIPELPEASIREAINKHEVIAGYGENVFCPSCLSKNRERLLKALLEDQFQLQGKSILHCSPEPLLHQYLRNGTEITTIDLQPGFYRSIEKNIRYADVTDLSFPDESFDVVVANHILEHIPEDLIAMKEFYRVIKKGGIAILQVPYSEKLTTTIEDKSINDPIRQEVLYGQKDHVRIYAYHDFINRVQSVGFRAKVFEPSSMIAYRRYAIQENEAVFVFVK